MKPVALSDDVMPARAVRGAGLMLALALGACAGDPMGPGSTIEVNSGPTSVRQGDVVVYEAVVRGPDGSPIAAALSWRVEPADAGLLKSDGRFVAYQPGPARIVAELAGQPPGEAVAAELQITITPRDVDPGVFSVVGRGAVSERYTSDLWLVGGVAYTGTWGDRNGNLGDRLYAWDVTDPSNPVRTHEVVVDAGTVNDVKIRADGTLAVLTHEGSSPNGITLLDLTDPLRPSPITQFSATLEPGVHNVWIEGDFIYAVVDGSVASSGLRIIDVSVPAAPQVASSFYGGDPAITFGQFLHDVYVRDGLAFLSHWNAGLIVLDVGNGMAGGSPQSPVEVGRLRTQGDQTHNAWYWPTTGYAFVGEEDFGSPGIMHVVDASDPANPREVASYRVPGDTPHNFWLEETEEILYLAWYSQGVQALDVSGELMGELEKQGRLIASLRYDGTGSCPGSGTCSWGPQLHDGIVWISDLNSGLWALELTF